jgi:hypothetical protein
MDLNKTFPFSEDSSASAYWSFAWYSSLNFTLCMHSHDKLKAFYSSLLFFLSPTQFPLSLEKLNSVSIIRLWIILRVRNQPVLPLFRIGSVRRNGIGRRDRWAPPWIDGCASRATRVVRLTWRFCARWRQAPAWAPTTTTQRRQRFVPRKSKSQSDDSSTSDLSTAFVKHKSRNTQLLLSNILLQFAFKRKFSAYFFLYHACSTVCTIHLDLRGYTGLGRAFWPKLSVEPRYSVPQVQGH